MSVSSPQSPYTTMTNDQLARATVSLDILVRFVETDAMGVVHHSNYLVWFEAARVAWMDAADMPYAEVAAGGHHFAVTAVEVEYRAPVRFGETVRVTVAVRQLRSRSVRFTYTVSLSSGGGVLARGCTEHICVDLDGHMAKIPEPVLRRFELGVERLANANEAAAIEVA